MFLSKKWILILISITGISFLILLFIQFGWTRKTIEMDRQQLDTKMRQISNKIHRAILSERSLPQKLLDGSTEASDFSETTSSGNNPGGIIKKIVDSILKAEKAPLSSGIIGRTGHSCYLMSYVPDNERSANIDHSQFKLCLCNSSLPVSLDIGFNLLPSSKLLGSDSGGLILPSVVLILLLIGVFAYAIFIINRQKKLAELKNDFINNLTHEFNTPLFSMGITSNLLSRSDVIQRSDKLKSYVDLITTEKNRIQAQVDKILQLTAVESGNMIMDLHTIDVNELLKEAIQSFEMFIAEQGGKVSLSTNGSSHFVKGDKIHLLNAFSNLLDNACKYSDKPPAINITTSNINGELLISIADSGIGMKKNEMNMIFSKFYRVKNGDRHDVKGFGLGLSYVRKIIELHKGSIEVKSKPGEGSVFIIHLPYSSNN